MIGKTPRVHQMTFHEVALESFIDMNHELVQLSKAIDWSEVESEFSGYYCSDNGRPGVPIRKMVGLMLLKNIYDLSDEEVVARWMENPYMQYFTGETVFQKRPPMNPIDMTKFRKRIGAEGAEKIFKLSLMVNAKEITAKEMKMVMIDSTVQEKIISFPTDAKLYRKVIEKVRTIAEKEEIELRRTYTRELKALKLKIRSKGKEHKKYEFGNKSGIAKTRSGLIVSALAFHGNPYDGHTLPDHLDQIERLTGFVPEEAVSDRGYRGRKIIGQTRISIPTSGGKGQTYYQKTKERKKFRKRAGIEPVIGHLKSDHRMIRNYLRGTLGDAINTMLAAAAYNLRHWMNKLPHTSFVCCLRALVRQLEKLIFENQQHYPRLHPVLTTLAK